MSQIQRALRACAETKVTPLTPHWPDDARRLMRQAADALDAAEEVMAENRAQAPAEGAGVPPLRVDELKAAFPVMGDAMAELRWAYNLGAQRALASKAQPKGMPAEWLDAFEEWRQTLGAADLDGKRDLVWRHIAGTGFQAGAAWARSQAPAPVADVEGGDLPCPRCNGSGFELQWSDASPDAHQVEVNCDHCDGAGSLGAAYTHLSQMLKSERERSKKHTDELHWLKSGPFFGLRADKSVQTVADRLDELADACGKYDPRSERASDIRAAATIWRKHLAGPVPCAAVAHPAWQPIKTAPKDGTHILVWTDASDTAYVVCWADAAKGIRKYLTAESGAERGWHLAWDGELFDREHEPTHWMPLPDAPTAQEEQDLDAWECTDCGGAGRRTVYHAVTHQLGTDELPFWEPCETCGGVGYCGPDAEKRAALSKPPVQGTAP